MSISKSFLLRIVACLFMIVFSSCGKVTVKTGDKFETIELPDGSLVYLNHDSSIKYKKSFNPRHIKLNGEAFFIIAPDETSFIITTFLGEINVPATEFNVKSGKDELEVEVKEGSVELRIKQQINKLKHGERAVYNKNKDLLKKVEAEFKYEIWMNDLEIEFEKLGKEFKKSGQKVGKEFKKMGKEIKKKSKN